MSNKKVEIGLSAYFVISFFAYFLVTQNQLTEASFVKIMAVSLLGCLHFFEGRKVSFLFIFFLFFTALGELAVINRGEDVVELMSIASTSRFWLVIMMIKKNIRKQKFQKKYLIPILLVSIITMFLVISVLILIFEQVTYSLTLPIITAVSFVIMATYITVVFFNSKNMKNLWLLLTLVSDSITFVVAPVEALILPSIYLEAIIHVVVVASTFFVYKFLVTKEYKVELRDKTIYV